MWTLIPAVLLLGFVLVVLESSLGLLTGAVSVTVVRPRATQASSSPAGSVVLQAAGWVEPDPFPLRVTALAKGVIAELLVEESDVVEEGDEIASLVSEDAVLALEAAQAALARAQAEHRAASAELIYAKGVFDAALEVTEARDAARADHESRSAEVEHHRAAALEAQAAVEVALNELETQRYLKQGGAVGPWQVELAEARLKEARAQLSGFEAAVLRAVADEAKSAAHEQRAEGDFELRLEERRRIATAEATLARTDAEQQAATVALSEAQLRVERMTVRSPFDGVVLSRDAQAGTVVGPAASDSPICQLYDPRALRVRVDVPQNQVAAASVDMRAEIRCDARRGQPYEGRVLRIVQKADIQKVTLEVQVRVLDPDGAIKPDMLCQVAILGDGESDDSAPRVSAVRIPSRCLSSDDSVWVVDGATGRARRREVRTGGRDGDDMIILEGLNASDKVIDRGREELSDDARIRVESDR